MTQLPGVNSDAIDAGSSPGGTDQRDLPRIVDLAAYANVDNGCDIGAVEVGTIVSGTVLSSPLWAE